MFELIVALAAISFASGQSYPRPVASIIRVENGEDWGSWKHDDLCPHGSFAYGFRVKVETYQSAGDDTGINAIQLICAFENDRRMHGGYVESGYGQWGHWTGWHYCKDSEYLTSFSLKVEPDQGWMVDDTAVNGIRFGCREIKADSSFNVKNYLEEKEVGQFGNYGHWSHCPKGSAICGIQTRVEDNQYGGDDTALNDVRFHCCRPEDDPTAILIG